MVGRIPDGLCPKIALMRSNHKLKIEKGKSRNFSHFSGCCCCCLPAIRYLGLQSASIFRLFNYANIHMAAVRRKAFCFAVAIVDVVIGRSFLVMPSFNRAMPYHAITVIHTVTDVLLNFVHFDFIFGIICISVEPSLSLYLFGGVSFCG